MSTMSRIQYRHTVNINPVHMLVENNANVKEFRKIVKDDPSQVSWVDSIGRTVFHKLAILGHHDIVKVTRVLLEIPEDDSDDSTDTTSERILDSSKKQLLEMQDKSYGCTALHPAVELGRVEFVAELLRLCPSLNEIQNHTGNIPLHLTHFDHAEVTKCLDLLLNVGPPTIIYHQNSSLHTPLGILCFVRRTSKPKLERMRLLLSVDKNNENSLLKNVDKYERSPLHSCCNWVDMKENENANLPVETLKLFLSHCNNDGETLNLQDNNGSTALHIATYSQNPEMVRLLLKQHGVNFMIKDQSGRTPLHYAASLGCISRCFETVKMLSNPNLIKRLNGTDKKDKFIKYLIADMDGVGRNTPLTLACLSVSFRSVNAILVAAMSIVDDPKLWFNPEKYKLEDIGVLSLQMVYQFTPRALISLLDKGILPDTKSIEESIAVFETDFSILTGLRNPLENKIAISEMENFYRASDWDSETQEGILLHPLVQCFLFLLWKKLLPLKILLVVYNGLWLMSYWALITFDDPLHGIVQKLSAYCLILLCIVSCINQMNKICALGFRNGVSLRSCTMGLQIVLALGSVKSVVLDTPEMIIETYFTAFGAMFAFTLAMRNLALVNLQVGLQVEYLLQMFRRIFFVLCCCSPLIFGFSLGFQKLAYKPFQHPSLWVLIKTIVMMTGEYDYESMFHDTAPRGIKNASDGNIYKVQGERIEELDSIIFFAFLIVVPITFYNLLTGIAVEKVKDLHKRAKINLVLSQIYHIHYIQSSLLQISYALPCLTNVVIRHFFATQEMSKYATGKRWDYCPLVTWKIRKCTSQAVRPQPFYSSHKPTVIGDGLPNTVKNRIFRIIYADEYSFTCRFSDMDETKVEYA